MNDVMSINVEVLGRNLSEGEDCVEFGQLRG